MAAPINPRKAGRPPLTPEEREARLTLSRATPEALERVLRCLRSADDEMGFKAAKLILDKVIADGTAGILDIPDADLVAELRRRVDGRTDGSAPTPPTH